MIFYIIFTVILAFSLGAIIFIVVKNFSRLAVINIESVPKEKETKIKNRIIKDRLARKFFGWKKALAEFFTPIAIDLGAIAGKFYQDIMKWEKKIQPVRPLQKIDRDQEISDKLIAADKLLAEQKLAEAEEICIAVLNLDDKNAKAYQSLVTIYSQAKDYKKARQTARFLLKLLANGPDKHVLANCYADLGQIYQLENKPALALANFQKAVTTEPLNPRFLDLLLKTSIILKNKKLASQAFSALKEADPENQKLAELKAEIDNLPDLLDNN